MSFDLKRKNVLKTTRKLDSLPSIEHILQMRKSKENHFFVKRPKRLSTEEKHNIENKYPFLNAKIEKFENQIFKNKKKDLSSFIKS